ncbi:hypothetical protein HYV88_06120 [Candidatus Woesearchaeota archaeon]|nr:hypothetical protein [Candidatus Woesearchaeota archaeon]
MIIGKISIKPTEHYLKYHSAEVRWDLVVKTILSPTKCRLNKRRGKNRFTYIKRFKKYVIELHVEKDPIEEIVWVINAFKIWR